MKSRIALATLFLASAAHAQPAPSAVTAACQKAVYKAASQALKTAHIKYDGLGDVNSDLSEPNTFWVDYSFDDECLSSVTVKINPTKVQVNGTNSQYTDAVECEILEATPSTDADCG